MSNVLTELLQSAWNENADLILATGGPPFLRNHRTVTELDHGQCLTSEDICEALEMMVTPQEKSNFESGSKLLMVITVNGIGRFRLSAAQSGDVDTIVLRPISERFMDWDASGLPDIVMDYSKIKPRHLLFISGTPNSGRTTTVARLIRDLKFNGGAHVVMLERSAEFEFNVDGLIVTRLQKTDSIAGAVSMISMMNPEVVVFDEIKNFEELDACIRLAEAGAYVIAVCRQVSTFATLNHLLEMSPAEKSFSTLDRFSRVFGGCILHRSAGHKDNGARVLFSEVCYPHPGVRAIIRDEKIHRIIGMIQEWGEEMQSSTVSLQILVKNGVITLDEAKSVSESPEDLLHKIKVDEEKEASNRDS